MRRIGLLECALAAALLGTESNAQETLKPLEPGKAKTNYSFPIQSGSPLFRFAVQLDGTSSITGAQVFRPGESVPFQSLPACKRKDDLHMELTEDDAERELLKHQDLNFDGFEDVQLLQYYVRILASPFSASTCGIPRMHDFGPRQRFPIWTRLPIQKTGPSPYMRTCSAACSSTAHTDGMAQRSNSCSKMGGFLVAIGPIAASRIIAAG
jgi:hypothetical protein